MPGFSKSGFWNENNLNPLSRINWRASLVPAAAVIPAPIAYIKVVAVKKLVVEFLIEGSGSAFLRILARLPSSLGLVSLILTYRRVRCPSFTVSKLECSKQAFCH